MKKAFLILILLAIFRTVFAASNKYTVTFNIPEGVWVSIKGYGGNTYFESKSLIYYEGDSDEITFDISKIDNKYNGYYFTTIKLNDNELLSNVNTLVRTYKYKMTNIQSDLVFDVSIDYFPYFNYYIEGDNGGVAVSFSQLMLKISENADYGSYVIRKGSSATITFTPNSGYQINEVIYNNTNITSKIQNNQYTFDNITDDIILLVSFKEIPPPSYTLSIYVKGNGSVSFDGTTIRNNTNTFTINEGTSASISITPDNGFRIMSVKENDMNTTSYVSDGKYTINSISRNTIVEVEFEEIPTTIYDLSIKATGNGSALYNGISVKNSITNFSVNSGTDATISFSPDSGCRTSIVVINDVDVTSTVSNNQYTINNISANTTMEVTFAEEDVNAITVDGVNYKVVSQSNKTVNVTSGSYGQVLTVPASISSNGSTWTVAGIETDALSGNSELAAVIWEPDATFNAAVSNPNLLLYVKSEAYAPASIQNVVVNGTASNIILKEASSGNNFYCPQAFTAQHISYTHNYQMQTGIGDSRGWETIALPFDVQTITHETKGVIVPFAQWKSGDTTKPFWLYELARTGFVEASNIKAYTPYIISMPNNPQYDSEWLLNGKVTFTASGVVVGKTEDLIQPTFNSRTFVPCFADKGADTGVYALNVDNDFETNNSGMTEGSKFVLNMRRVHPFEAFMTSSSSAPQYAFGVFEGMTTGIQMMINGSWTKENVVYDLQGRKVELPSKKGVYIVNGKKKMIK